MSFPKFFAVDLSPMLLNTVATNEIFQNLENKITPHFYLIKFRLLCKKVLTGFL